MEKLDLCEILMKHRGETFYCSIMGECTLYNIDKKCPAPIQMISKKTGAIRSFTGEGFYLASETDSECLLFPSKDQRDWSKWIRENDPVNIVTPIMDTIYDIMHQGPDSRKHFERGFNHLRSLGFRCSFEEDTENEKEIVSKEL